MTRLPEPTVDTAHLAEWLRARGFVEVGSAPHLVIDLRYATADNFLSRPVYGNFDRLFLHPIAAEKLRIAAALLGARASGHRFIVFDGLRPNRIQRLMWRTVERTPKQIYVGDPAVGSIHGYGLAVDLSLLGSDGRECDMGTPFDDFSPLAEPRREAAFLKAGALSATQIADRHLLREIMVAAGFHPIAVEWWHFDALPPDLVRHHFPLIE